MIMSTAKGGLISVTNTPTARCKKDAANIQTAKKTSSPTTTVVGACHHRVAPATARQSGIAKALIMANVMPMIINR
jgi:hypothetical protein